MKTIRVLYFAKLRDDAGCSEKTVQSDAGNLGQLYADLAQSDGLTLGIEHLKVALNGDFASFDCPFNDGDEVAWIPPVAGG